MAFSPTMTPKQRNRECAYKIKHGSPKLQEVLRERCRQRMRDKREQLFNAHRFRPDPEQIQDTLEYIIRQEFQNLMTEDANEADLKVEDIDETLMLENEVVHEQEQWIFEEYEKLLESEVKEEIYADNDDKEIFCPICQRGMLEEINNCVTCRVCELRLTNCTLPEASHLINRSLNIHAFNCDKTGTFTVLPDNYGLNLYLMCHDCYTLALIL